MMRLRSSSSQCNDNSERHAFSLGWGTHKSNVELVRQPLTLTVGWKTRKEKVPQTAILIPPINVLPSFQPSVILGRNESFWTRSRQYSMAAFLGGQNPRMPRGPRRYRKYFLDYAKKHWNGTMGGKPYRLVALTGGKNSSEIRDSGGAFTVYQDSVVCPVLPGDSAWQRRFFDVLMNGCLPLVIEWKMEHGLSWHTPENDREPKDVYPFHPDGYYSKSITDIDNDSFVVRVPGDRKHERNFSLVKTVVEELLANPEELKRKQLSLMKNAHKLSFGLGLDAHKYDDMFQRTLQAMGQYSKSLGPRKTATDPYSNREGAISTSTVNTSKTCLIHIGKAGGSTLTCLAGIPTHACRQGSRKWKQYNEERQRSVIVQQLQGIGREHLHDNKCKPGFDSFLVLTRNPITRLKSWFYYEKPMGMNAHSFWYGRQFLWKDCFDRFEDLVVKGLGQNISAERVPPNVPDMSCSQRAWAAVLGARAMSIISHSYYNYEYYYETMEDLEKHGDPLSTFVLRNEHLASDWNTIDSMMGGSGKGGDALFSKKLNANAITSSETLSEEAMKVLCSALCDEIQYYKRILIRAINLMPRTYASPSESYKRCVQKKRLRFGPVPTCHCSLCSPNPIILWACASPDLSAKMQEATAAYQSVKRSMARVSHSSERASEPDRARDLRKMK